MNYDTLLFNILAITAFLIIVIGGGYVLGSALSHRRHGGMIQVDRKDIRQCRKALKGLRQELDLEQESHEMVHPGGVFKYALSSSTEDRGIDFTLWRHWHDQGAWHVDVEPRGFSNPEAFRMRIGQGTIEEELKKVAAVVRERLATPS